LNNVLQVIGIESSPYCYLVKITCQIPLLMFFRQLLTLNYVKLTTESQQAFS